MTKKFLVTGGAGFIGSHVVDRLVNDGQNVRIIDNLSTGNLENIKGPLASGAVEFVNGDIRDAAIVAKCMQGITSVIHLAALVSVPLSVENPDLTFDINLLGTLNLLREGVKAKIPKFVFISSCAVYGEPEFLPLTEEAHTHPISPYADSKLIAERYCLGFSERQLLQTAILRFFNVYGPRQKMNAYSGVITRFIDAITEEKPLTIYGDGQQTRDFVNVKDVASAVVSVAEDTSIDSGVFNIGSGKQTSILELANTLLDLSGADLDILHEAPRSGDIEKSYADIRKAKKLLGYEPKVDLRAGLQALLKEKTVLK